MTLFVFEPKGYLWEIPRSSIPQGMGSNQSATQCQWWVEPFFFVSKRDSDPLFLSLSPQHADLVAYDFEVWSIPLSGCGTLFDFSIKSTCLKAFNDIQYMLHVCGVCWYRYFILRVLFSMKHGFKLFTFSPLFCLRVRVCTCVLLRFF